MASKNRKRLLSSPCGSPVDGMVERRVSGGAADGRATAIVTGAGSSVDGSSAVALGGKISPLDHVTPEDLRIKELVDRIDREKISEIIFALAADVEGEATTNYIVDLLKGKSVALTRIARGIPAGGGLESADELTLSAALSGRTKL